MQDVNDVCKNDDSEKMFDEFQFDNDNLSSSELWKIVCLKIMMFLLENYPLNLGKLL